MEGEFISWFSSKFPTVCLIIGGCIFGCGILAGIIKLIKWYNNQIKDGSIKDIEEKQFKSKMIDLIDTVGKVEQSITSFHESQEIHNEEIDNRIEKLEEMIKNERKQSCEEDLKLSERLRQSEERSQHICNKVDDLCESLRILTVSDMEKIKTYITEEYYKAMKNQSIELFTMETIEARYKTYLMEHGDSFVEGMVKELRGLRKECSRKIQHQPLLDSNNRPIDE